MRISRAMEAVLLRMAVRGALVTTMSVPVQTRRTLTRLQLVHVVVLKDARTIYRLSPAGAVALHYIRRERRAGRPES